MSKPAPTNDMLMAIYSQTEIIKAKVELEARLVVRLGSKSESGSGQVSTGAILMRVEVGLA